MIKTKMTTKGQIDGLNIYLDAGNGRGRLASKATVYDCRVGYFFIRTETRNGKEAERIVFSTFDEGDIVVSDFSIFAPNRYPKNRIHEFRPIAIDYDVEGYPY